MADDLADLVQSSAQARGWSMGISGQGGVNTHYIGTAKSERRIRIYRKDLRDSEYAAMGPLLRVEVVLKAGWASRWWQIWNQDREDGFQVAQGYAEQMLGRPLTPEGGLWADREIKPPSPLAERIHALLRQHGPTLVALADLGFPLVSLARERVTRAHRATQWRMEQKRAEMADIGLAELVAEVRALQAR
jgi:hypothetical protein